jgi:cell division protein ZapB
MFANQSAFLRYDRWAGVDRQSARHYSGGMTSKRINALESVDLEQLADRIEELINICESLREENRSLRIRLASAEANQQRLVENGEHTRHRIETMISRLKVLEAEL